MSEITKTITMGEATKAVQGYATQVWIPVKPTRHTRDRVGILHHRLSAAYLLAGNSIDRVVTPGTEKYDFKLENGRGVRQIRIPDWVLWKNHGGPCSSRGDKYPVLNPRVMQAVYSRFAELKGERPIILPDSRFGLGDDYQGPFDFFLTSQPLQIGERAVFHLMNPDLLPHLRI